MPGAADVIEDRRDAVRRELAHARAATSSLR